MLIGILSDTHDEVEWTTKAMDCLRHLDFDYLFHCGDVTSWPIIELCAQLPLFFVFGNHDSDNVPELQEAAQVHNANCLSWGGVVEIGGRRVGVTHGHMNSDLLPIMQSQPDLLLTGHIHEKPEWIDGG